MSQRELAQRLSVSANAVSKWERGECDPSADKLKQLAKIFDTSTDHVLGI